MNLHRLVQPPPPRRPPPRITSRNVEPNGTVIVEFYGSTAFYGYGTDGRLDPRIIDRYEENRWPYRIYSARSRSRVYPCINGTVHTRYWTYGHRASRYGQMMCEHTIGISPITGEIAPEGTWLARS